LQTLLILAWAQVADYQQGVALIERGDPVAAVPYLARAAAADPKSAQNWKALGVAYAAQKNYAEAVAPFAKACALDPKLPDACYFQARALYALDRYEASLEALSRTHADTWRVRLARAQALEALARPEADHTFRDALAACRNADPEPATAYARYLLRQARAAEAIPILQPTLAAHPNAAEAHLYLGRALTETNQLAEALPHLERAATLAPTNAQAHLLLAKLYVRLNRPADAEPHFAQAQKYGAEQ
jgi:Flp pilus assembly protein TadD